MRLLGLRMRSMVVLAFVDVLVAFTKGGFNGNISTAYSYWIAIGYSALSSIQRGEDTINARRHLMMLEMGWRIYTLLRQHGRVEAH